ncbi:MAG: helix-turn-helix domain-containing protein, partial [Lachnospiraceae bacterium]|nr:helix-turn-helix domain-containing protein [Lachnospiraceae bacterium]
LYKNIKRLRVENNMTQDDLAKRLGYTDRSSVAKIEGGSVDLPISKIITCAEVFGVTPSYLMGWDPPSDISPYGSEVGRAYDEADDAIRQAVDKLLDVRGKNSHASSGSLGAGEESA